MFKFLKKLFSFKIGRDLTRQELRDIQELNQLCILERFKANHIKNNTVLFKNGPTYAAQQEVLANLLENIKEQIVSTKLTQLGYPKNQRCSINLETGEITQIETPIVQEVAVPQLNKK